MHGAVIMKAFPMFRTILRYLRHGPVTNLYPAVPAKKTPLTRGHLIIEIEKCIFCGLCSIHCPADAIVASKLDRTWKIDRFRCIICGVCNDYCPKDCLHLVPEYIGPQTSPFSDTYTGPVPAPSIPEPSAVS